MRLTVGVVLIFYVVWMRFLLVFLVGFVGIFRKFHCEFTKGFMCFLAWIVAFFFFFGGFLLVLKEIFIGGVVDASDKVMGFPVAKVPLEREF